MTTNLEMRFVEPNKASRSRDGPELVGVGMGVEPDRVVAVVAEFTGGRQQIGSGYLVGPDLVVTAAHCLHHAESGARAISCMIVRKSDGREESSALFDISESADIAIIFLSRLVDEFLGRNTDVLWAQLDRKVSLEINDCVAIGYPRWQKDLRDGQRSSAEIRGTIRTTDEAESGHYLLRDSMLDTVGLAPSFMQSDNIWGGLSGALVFARGAAIGIVVEHHERQGRSALRVLSIASLRRSTNEASIRIADALGVPERLPVLSVTCPVTPFLREQFSPYIEHLTRVFGGRERALEQIDRRRSNEHGWVAVTGGAGYGKSAFCAEIVKRSVPSDTLAYHFFSRSIFPEWTLEEFFLANLLEQFEGPGEDYSRFTTQQLRSRLIRLWGSSTPRLIVLDAVDEAQFDLAPYLGQRLSTGSLGVVSFRCDGEDFESAVNRLGLRSRLTTEVRLDGLTDKEVREVVRKAAVEAGAESPDPSAAEHIVVASRSQQPGVVGCDPMYVRYLAEDGWNSRAPHDPPMGMSEHFRRWWNDLKVDARDSVSREVLGYLVAAHGPLSQRDLETLCPNLLDDWDADRFNAVMRRIRRHVFGSRHAGFSLAHDRFKQYLVSPEAPLVNVRPYEFRLAEYCKAYATNGSQYALRYLPAHIRKLNVELLRQLVLDWRYLDLAVKAIGPDWVAQQLKGAGSTPDELVECVARMIELEAHNLRRVVAVSECGSVVNQLAFRALAIVQKAIYKSASEYLRSSKSERIVPQWVSSVSPKALERTWDALEQSLIGAFVSASGNRGISIGSEGRIGIYEPTTGRLLDAMELSSNGGFVITASNVDRSTVASVGRDGSIWAWRNEFGSISLQRERVVEGKPSCLIVSEDGSLLAVGSHDGHLVVLSIHDDESFILEGRHSDSVTSLLFSVDSSVLYSGSWDETVAVWNLASRECEVRLHGHCSGVGTLLELHSGKIVSASDLEIILWDGSEYVELERKSLDGVGAPVALAAEADETSITIVMGTTGIYVWRLNTGLVEKINTSLTGVSSVASTSKVLLVGGMLGELLVLDRVSLKIMTVLRAHSDQVRALGVNIGPRQVVSCGQDGYVRTWDLEILCRSEVPSESVGAIRKLLVKSSGEVLVSGRSPIIMMLSIDTGEQLSTLSSGFDVLAIELSPSGQVGVAGMAEYVDIWRLSPVERTGRFTGHMKWVSGVCFSPDGLTMATSGDDGVVRFYEVPSGICMSMLEVHRGAISAMASSPRSHRFVTCGWDGQLVLCDFRARVKNWRFAAASSLLSLTLSGEADFCVAGAMDGSVYVLDLKKCQLISRIDCHRGPVGAVSFASGCSLAISGGMDGTAALLDVAEGYVRSRLVGHVGPVTCVALHTRGMYALTAAVDKSVRLWDVARGLELGRIYLDSVPCSVTLVDDGRFLVGEESGAVSAWTLT